MRGNPTIYRHTQIFPNADGTTSEYEFNYKRNGHISTIVKIKDSNGHVLVVWHYVHDSSGSLIHGIHEEPKSRDPNYKGGPPPVIPPIGRP